ncbi:hypothetical protein Pmani_016075 [Petrolisthes manimaculis]|uniref:Uncharacterized protein n=1 Tax=Petrolisthes manimaculis TaxID=1843537 RepID=A0AAE1U6R7_9EUCA|nr:hypothetical protein Pmani_016075 [Petrolisthes manimaculis]
MGAHGVEENGKQEAIKKVRGHSVRRKGDKYKCGTGEILEKMLCFFRDTWERHKAEDEQVLTVTDLALPTLPNPSNTQQRPPFYHAFISTTWFPGTDANFAGFYDL